MNPDKPDLEVRFEGKALKSVGLPMDHILAITKTLSLVLIGVKRVYLDSQGIPEFVRPKIGLNVVSLRPDAESVILGLDIVDKDSSPTDHSKGLNILNVAISGLALLQSSLSKHTLPPGYDNRVIDAWLKAKRIFKKGIGRIQFTVNSACRETVTKGRLTSSELKYIRRYNRALKRKKLKVAVEGELLMVNVGNWRSRLTIYPRAGKRVQGSFNPDLRLLVASKVTGKIRIEGVATRFYKTGEVRKMKVKSIKPIEPSPFWDPASFRQPQKEQNVKPINDLSFFRGTWPGDLDDGFEESIDELRKGSLPRDD